MPFGEISHLPVSIVRMLNSWKIVLLTREVWLNSTLLFIIFPCFIYLFAKRFEKPLNDSCWNVWVEEKKDHLVRLDVVSYPGVECMFFVMV